MTEGELQADIRLSSNKPQVISNSYADGGWVNSSEQSNYRTYITNFDGITLSKFVYKVYLGTNYTTNNRSYYFYGSRITNNGVVVANVIPVKFKDTGRYGLLDTVSGNWIDRIASGSDVYYFSGE